MGMIWSQRREDTVESEAMLGGDMLTYQNLNITGHTVTPQPQIQTQIQKFTYKKNAYVQKITGTDQHHHKYKNNT